MLPVHLCMHVKEFAHIDQTSERHYIIKYGKRGGDKVLGTHLLIVMQADKDDNHI